jgi:hypothetical protein
MRRFRVINNSIDIIDDKGIRKTDEMIITVYNPPYEDEDVLSHTKWKLKDCTITEIKQYREIEE